ncbi:unnamed protein product [Caenorhabditis auriculariae]|uniref:Thymidylate kinase-like domain-containing protein n=1 Tax=Caenorhabditis auriculariae TaxID=2777116 RepID=A0A8S1HRA0_9PELO|nr:unnamed protein product [Caenorhabditis auriculariae]
MGATAQNGVGRRGVLIVFEGLDRSGKSTQARRLLDFINKEKGQGDSSSPAAILQAFPDRKEPFGQVIDKYLRKEIDLCERALHLAFSANRWEKESLIREKNRRRRRRDLRSLCLQRRRLFNG